MLHCALFSRGLVTSSARAVGGYDTGTGIRAVHSAQPIRAPCQLPKFCRVQVTQLANPSLALVASPTSALVKDEQGLQNCKRTTGNAQRQFSLVVLSGRMLLVVLFHPMSFVALSGPMLLIFLSLSHPVLLVFLSRSRSRSRSRPVLLVVVAQLQNTAPEQTIHNVDRADDVRLGAAKRHVCKCYACPRQQVHRLDLVCPGGDALQKGKDNRNQVGRRSDLLVRQIQARRAGRAVAEPVSHTEDQLGIADRLAQPFLDGAFLAGGFVGEVGVASPSFAAGAASRRRGL